LNALIDGGKRKACSCLKRQEGKNRGEKERNPDRLKLAWDGGDAGERTGFVKKFEWTWGNAGAAGKKTKKKTRQPICYKNVKGGGRGKVIKRCQCETERNQDGRGWFFKLNQKNPFD